MAKLLFLLHQQSLIPHDVPHVIQPLHPRGSLQPLGLARQDVLLGSVPQKIVRFLLSYASSQPSVPLVVGNNASCLIALLQCLR